MSATPTKEEIAIASQALQCSPSDFKVSAPVRLYTSTNGQTWDYTGSHGIAGVVMDPKLSIIYIQVVDLNTRTVVLNQEAYKDFNYVKLSPCMHAFEGDDAVYGLNFAESFDAEVFATTTKGLLTLCNSTFSMQPKATTAGNGASTPPKITTTKKVPPTSQEKASFGSKLKGTFGGLFGKKEQPRQRPTISGAKNFKHVSHLGFSGKNGFGNIPPEWKAIFDKAGVTEEELKDVKTAKFLMKTIASAGDVPLPPVPTRGAPPAPPTSNHAAPPPPPGPMKSAPPPPPKDGPAPPPPPSAQFNSGSVTPTTPTAAVPDMLTLIREKKLKKVSEEDIPKVDEMDEDQQNSLAAKIQQAMQVRRTAVVDDDSDDDDSDEEDWEI